LHREEFIADEIRRVDDSVHNMTRQCIAQCIVCIVDACIVWWSVYCVLRDPCIAQCCMYFANETNQSNVMYELRHPDLEKP